eukprot:tig00021127_g18712.t1
MARAVSWVMVAAVLCAVYAVASGSGAVPPIKWAQRTGSVWITIDLSHAENVKVTFEEEGRLHFSAEATVDGERKQYELDTKLFKSINASDCTHKVLTRHVELDVKKKAVEKKHWKRLLADAGEERKLSRLGLLKRDWLRFKGANDKEGEVDWNYQANRPWKWWEQEEENDDDDEDEL